MSGEITNNSDIFENTDLNNGDFLSVGFIAENSIAPLMTFFGPYMDKVTNMDVFKKKILSQTNDETKKQTLLLQDLVSSNKNEKNKTAKEIKESFKELSKNLKDSAKDKSGFFGKYESRLMKIADAGLKAAATQLQQAQRTVSALRQIDSSGVKFKGGIDGVLASVEKTGISIDEIGAAIANSSKTIAKFNTSTGNGVSVWEDTIEKLNKNTTLTSNEQIALLNSFMESRSVLEKDFTSEEFQQAFTKYVKNMQLFSKATGQSVESLIQEQKLKDNHRVTQTFQMAFEPQAKALGRLGLGADLERYLISGGVSNIKEAVLASAESPVMKYVLDSLLEKGVTNIDDDYINELLKSAYTKFGDSELNRLKSNVSNSPLTTGAYQHNDFAAIHFGGLGQQVTSMGKQLLTNQENPDDGNGGKKGGGNVNGQDEETYKILKDAKDVQIDVNKLEAEVVKLITGGNEGFKATVNLAKDAITETTKIVSGVNTGIDTFAKKLSELVGIDVGPFVKAMAGFSASSVSKAIPDLISGAVSAIVSGFTSYFGVNKAVEKGLIESSKTSKSKTKSKTKTKTKTPKSKPKSPKLSPKGAGKALSSAGKVVGALGTVATAGANLYVIKESGEILYDMYDKGVENTINDLKEDKKVALKNILSGKGTIDDALELVDPVSMTAIASDIAGGIVGDLAYDVIGKSENKFKVTPEARALIQARQQELAKERQEAQLRNAENNLNKQQISNNNSNVSKKQTDNNSSNNESMNEQCLRELQSISKCMKTLVDVNKTNQTNETFNQSI